MLRSFRGAVVLSVLAFALNTACDPLPSNSSASGQLCGGGVNSQTNGAQISLNSTQLSGMTTDLAQSFSVSNDTFVASAILRLIGPSSPIPGSITLTIEGDAGHPNGIQLSSGFAQIAAATVGSNYANYTFNFPNEVSLSPNTTYWMRLSQQATVNSSVAWAAAIGGNGTSEFFNSQAFQWQTVESAFGGQARTFLFTLGCVNN